MKLVREPEPTLNQDAIRARLHVAIRECVPEAAVDSLVDIPALLAEVNQLLRLESDTRREFADLLAASRQALDAPDIGRSQQLTPLCVVVGLHDEITPQQLDAWGAHTTTDPDQKEALNT